MGIGCEARAELFCPGLSRPNNSTSKLHLGFETDIDCVGVISVNVTRAWAPLGADHLFALVNDGFYDGAEFFCVYGGFLLQFGIAGTPAENVIWQAPIKDDPLVQSNLKHTIAYAISGDTLRKNARTIQLFINY